ncbi:MAG TPA: hypothetical protein VFA18_25805 [Gemmataceae bacterium]|nr:hypothetical protein [Gemmataceae bacterium]
MKTLRSIVVVGLCLALLPGCRGQRVPERPSAEAPALPVQHATSEPAAPVESFVGRTNSPAQKEQAILAAVQRLSRIQNTILRLRLAIFNAENYRGPLQSSERISIENHQRALAALSHNPDGTLWSGDPRALDELRPRFDPVIDNYNRENQELQRTLAEAARNGPLHADLLKIFGAGPVPCTTARLPAGSGEMPPERWPDMERLVQSIHELTEELKRITTETGVQVYANRPESLPAKRQDLVKRAAEIERTMSAHLSPQGAAAIRGQYQDALAQLDQQMERLRGLPGGDALVDGRRPVVHEPANPPVLKAPQRPSAVSSPTTPPALSPAVQVFFVAHRKVMAISQELLRTLDSVTDEASAREAGPHLAKLTLSLPTAMRNATALLLTLSKTEQQTVMVQGALEAEKAQRALKLAHPNDNLIDQMVRVARGPGGGILRTELRDLRDAFLSSHGPYATVTVRKRIVQRLGPLGSELTPR